jgi:hypothetical protein
MRNDSGVTTYTLALDDRCRGSHGEKNGRLHRASDVIEINQEVKKSVSGCQHSNKVFLKERKGS